MPASIQISFKNLISEIVNLPVWIKQVIYMELKDEFENSTFKNCIITTSKRDLLQLYIPKITYSGKKELENRSGKYSENIYTFLETAIQEYSVMEIAVSNKWNLHECSKYFLESINAEFISMPSSPIIRGTALYMSGEIRLGEYFVKIGKISIEELNKALHTQKNIEESMGDRPGLAEIMINLGYLTKDDTDGILLLKDDCHKYFNPTFSQN